jgi:hypothetical protein
MAGHGSRFTEFGFRTPKFLLPIDDTGKTMIQAAVETLNCPTDSTYSFVTLKNILSDSLKNSLKKFNGSWGTPLTEVTDGPATTALQGLPDDENVPILISNSDQILQNWDCVNFLEKCDGYDGAVLTYTPPYEIKIGDTDKHSYVNKEGTLFAEKTVLSNDALIGVHYFRNRSVFIDAYNDMVSHNNRAPNGEFYISLMYNSVVQLGGKVRVVPLQTEEQFFPTGEPNDYFTYLNQITHFGPKNMERFNFTVGDLNVSLQEVDSITNERRVVGAVLTGTGRGTLFLSKQIRLTTPRTLLVIQHPILEEEKDKMAHIDDMTRGWSVGDFEPSFIRTNLFEIGILTHKKGEKWPFHIHDELAEYNHLLSGDMLINGIKYTSGDSFMFEKGHPAVPEFLTDCEVICIKVPSVPGDKRII